MERREQSSNVDELIKGKLCRPPYQGYFCQASIQMVVVGGAGGRIGIHARQNNEYGGQLLAYGEMGTSSGDRGGPGTVFVEDKTGLFSYQSRLYLDGKNLEKPKPVIYIEGVAKTSLSVAEKC
jgi:hypothetical protein